MVETATPFSDLMTVEQACVEHFYYSEETHAADREGMIFGGRGAASYKPLRQGPSKSTLCIFGNGKVTAALSLRRHPTRRVVASPYHGTYLR